MPPGLLSKETNSCHKTSGFHKNSLQNRNNPNDNTSLPILRQCSYTRYYGVGYIEYSIFAILSRLYPVEMPCRVECRYREYLLGIFLVVLGIGILLRLVRPFRFDFKLPQFSFLVYGILLTCIVQTTTPYMRA